MLSGDDLLNELASLKNIKDPLFVKCLVAMWDASKPGSTTAALWVSYYSKIASLLISFKTFGSTPGKHRMHSKCLENPSIY